jgi:uncharacterized RDD family membrane protein YckC
MSQNGTRTEKEPAPEMEQIRQWQRFLSVVYRLLIIFGLITIAFWVVLVVFTSFIPLWSIVFPVIIIITGIILARYEYTLHNRISKK